MALDTIFLVRHGEAAASWGENADPPLSPLGRDQAVEASRTLLRRVDANSWTLISSPLARARETADPLAAALAMEVTIDPRFREIPAPVPLEERQPWLRSVMRQCWSEQIASVQTWREELIGALQHLPASTVVFTHFLVINAVVGALQGRDDTLVCWPANASITELRVTASGVELLQIGEQMRSRVN